MSSTQTTNISDKSVGTMRSCSRLSGAPSMQHVGGEVEQHTRRWSASPVAHQLALLDATVVVYVCDRSAAIELARVWKPQNRWVGLSHVANLGAANCGRAVRPCLTNRFTLRFVRVSFC